MNDARQILSWFFAAFIFITASWSPWEKTIQAGDAGVLTIEELRSPIWEAPQRENGGRIRLRTEILAVEWIGGSLIY